MRPGAVMNYPRQMGVERDAEPGGGWRSRRQGDGLSLQICFGPEVQKRISSDRTVRYVSHCTIFSMCAFGVLMQMLRERLCGFP